MASELRLDGKVALVTGSTRGIGWACARAFAGAGATVILNGLHDGDLLAARAESLRRDYGVACCTSLGGVSDYASVQQCYADIFKSFKRLDILVNNAGVLSDALLGMIPQQLIENVL